jgi:hypothetical protein
LFHKYFCFAGARESLEQDSLEVQMKSKPANKISDDVRREIEVRAYLIWESDGRPHGCEKEHWALAEAEILGTKPIKKAAVAKTNGVAKTVVAAKAKRAVKGKPSKPAHREG